jgi:hypothetical protein
VKKYGVVIGTLLFLLAATGTNAQVYQSGDLATHIDAIIGSMPTAVGGGDYLQPALSSRQLWREIVDHILAGEYALAHTDALTKSYQVVIWTDTAIVPNPVHVVLERAPGATSRYWGTFVFNTAPKRQHLVIQSPHPIYDSNTGYQGIRMYRTTSARAFFISGTHRCNGTSYTPCDGTTSACSDGYEAYRYSDMAHVVDSTYQVTTEALLDNDPSLIIVQAHGFAQGTGDPDLVISNGTISRPTGTDYAASVAAAIEAIDGTLDAAVIHLNPGASDLWATNNTQGRLLNGSSEPCGTPAISATGRFVHVEQARVGLRDTAANWTKLANAVAAAIPVDASPVPGDIVAPGQGIAIVNTYANPFQGRTRVEFSVGRSGPVEMDVYDIAGRRVAHTEVGSYETGVHSVEWNAEQLPAGTYILKLRQGDMSDSRRCQLLR